MKRILSLGVLAGCLLSSGCVVERASFLGKPLHSSETPAVVRSAPFPSPSSSPVSSGTSIDYRAPSAERVTPRSGVSSSYAPSSPNEPRGWTLFSFEFRDHYRPDQK